MNSVMRVAVAFAAGAAAMYYLDPETGRRRRALTRDKGRAFGHDARDAARATSRHAAKRVRGSVAEARSHLGDEPVDDVKLHARIRARLGRVVDHPGEVDVTVRDGNVLLTGSASMEEIERLRDVLETMHGVASVESRLTASAAH
jgi:osmotically-inducible protein OsmY